MKKTFTGGLAAGLMLALALMISACAGTPTENGSSQARAECRDLPGQTGSRLPRRSCRDGDSSSSDD